MHPFRVKKLAGQAAAFPLPALVRAHALAVRTHEQMVSGVLEPELLLELFVARLLGRVPAARAGAPAAP